MDSFIWSTLQCLFFFYLFVYFLGPDCSAGSACLPSTGAVCGGKQWRLHQRQHVSHSISQLRSYATSQKNIPYSVLSPFKPFPAVIHGGSTWCWRNATVFFFFPSLWRPEIIGFAAISSPQLDKMVYKLIKNDQLNKAMTAGLTPDLFPEQKNLLVLRAAAVQPEQWRELLWHAGELVTGVHCGDFPRPDQQWRRGNRRNEHGSRRGSSNQQQFRGLPDGQCWTPPCHPDRTSLPGHCKWHGGHQRQPSLTICPLAFEVMIRV